MQSFLFVFLDLIVGFFVLFLTLYFDLFVILFQEYQFRRMVPRVIIKMAMVFPWVIVKSAVKKLLLPLISWIVMTHLLQRTDFFSFESKVLFLHPWISIHSQIVSCFLSIFPSLPLSIFPSFHLCLSLSLSLFLAFGWNAVKRIMISALVKMQKLAQS